MSNKFIEVASSKLATELVINANIKGGGNEVATKVLTNLISASADLLMSGKATRTQVSMALASKMADIIGIGEDQALLCGTALAQLVLTLGSAPRDVAVYSIIGGPEGGVVIEAAWVAYQALQSYMACSLAYNDHVANVPTWSAAKAAQVSGDLNQLAKLSGANACVVETP